MNESMKKPPAQWLVCGLLAAVTLAVYASVVENPFINLDDPDYVINNLHVRQGLTADTVRWAFVSVHNTNWHPLTSLSHAWDCQLYGLDPMGHHLTSLVFHVINTMLLFLLLQNLTAGLWASAFVALLFGIHPMHVESVAWVSERKDMLSGFFFLLTLLAYVRYAQCVTGDRWQVTRTAATTRAPDSSRVARLPAEALAKAGHPSRFYWLALVFFALGLMSKPMLVTVPCVLLLLDYWPLRRVTGDSWRVTEWKKLVLEKIPFFILTALSCWVTILAQTQALKPASDFPLAARLAHVPVAYAWYLFKLVWPVEHSIYYILDVNQASGKVIGALLLLCFVTGILVWQARRHPYLIFGWLWFLVMLVPVAGFVQAGNQAYAEHYTYLPYIGLFILFAWGIPALLGKRPLSKPLLWGAAIFISAVCCKLTIAQVHVWKKAETLFKQAVDEDDHNEKAWILYGLQFNHIGNPDRAIECLRQAISIKPGSMEAWYNLGRLLVIKGKYDEAQSAFETALVDGRQQRPLIYKSLADLFLKTGKTREAITNFEYSLELQPDQPEANFLLGKAYLADHQLEKAAGEFEKAIRLYRDNPEAELGLAMIYGSKGRDSDAIVHYRRVIELETNSVTALNALNNLAWMLATDSDPRLRNGGEAVRLARHACELTRYEQAFLIGTLAAAYAEAGRFNDAVITAQKARDVALAHGQKEVAASNERLMETYKSGRAFHEEAHPAP
jgi:Tfp pilus assembly protein PilF